MAEQPRGSGSIPGSANTFLPLRTAQNGSRSRPLTYSTAPLAPPSRKPLGA